MTYFLMRLSTDTTWIKYSNVYKKFIFFKLLLFRHYALDATGFALDYEDQHVITNHCLVRTVARDQNGFISHSLWAKLYDLKYFEPTAQIPASTLTITFSSVENFVYIKIPMSDDCNRYFTRDYERDISLGCKRYPITLREIPSTNHGAWMA